MDAVNRIVGMTPKEDPAGRKIRLDAATLAERVNGLLREHQALTGDVLVQSWADYLATEPAMVKAPQYFFGRKDDQKDGAHWRAYAALIWHRQAKASRMHDQAPDEVQA
ncbi:hypothetical protein [Mesoterricola sediminis]|uniref:hypothetical protein n=1 Tax=Mesoterricola sediminis TaxID=2927980 RepID=UPI00292D66AE|nr:hypothetical protein [Mesoterricola sediminis]